MAKWADYLISGIWFSGTNESKHVSSVMLHVDKGDKVAIGEKKSKDFVINLIKDEKTVCTIKWDYNDATWSKGAKVSYEKIGGTEYLRTQADATNTDNLDNLIRMFVFGI